MTFIFKNLDELKGTQNLGEILVARIGASLVVIFLLVLTAFLISRFLISRIQDVNNRYVARKFVTYTLVTLGAGMLLFLWAPLSQEFSIVIALVAAGIAFASQEAIGAIFGWISIMSGRVYAVGDRIMIEDMRGEVIDISPLRTKLFELGGAEPKNWISGRQYTGRIVTFSNRLVLEQPVYNYSSHFDYIWDEYSVVIQRESNWQRAKEILREVVSPIVAEISHKGQVQSQEMKEYYPIEDFDTDLRLFVELEDNGIRLTARFLVSLAGVRRMKTNITEQLLLAYEENNIPLAYPVQEIHLQKDSK